MIGTDRVVIAVAPLSDAQQQGLAVGDRVPGPKEALRAPLELKNASIGATGSAADVACAARDRKLAPQHPAYRPAITVRPGETLGYIRIDRFDDGAAELADRALEELKDTQGIVIDVRGGGGGNLSWRLVSYFSGVSKQYGRPACRGLSREARTPRDQGRHR
ncbi:MAG: S41 family peptidase [Alphaproteobacteria bacterium]